MNEIYILEYSTCGGSASPGSAIGVGEISIQIHIYPPRNAGLPSADKMSIQIQVVVCDLGKMAISRVSQTWDTLNNEPPHLPVHTVNRPFIWASVGASSEGGN